MPHSEYLLKTVHEEYAKRMEEEHSRIHHRLSDMERIMDRVENLTESIATLSFSVKEMSEQIKLQNTRLSNIESRDGENWRKLIGYIITAVAGIIIGLVAKTIGL